jgi:hypothetical protein
VTDGPIRLAYGRHGSFYLDAKLVAEWKAIHPRHRRHLLKHMDTYSELGPDSLNKKQYRHEGRHKSGGKDSREYHVYAFKSDQHRLYGARIKFSVGQPPSNVEAFLITAYDQKKQMKADPEVLTATARRLRVLDKG